MARLSNFTPQEQALLLRVPYAVGLWMSAADDERGDLDDQKETAHLKKVIGVLAHHNHDHELVADVFSHLNDFVTEEAFDETIEGVMDRVRAALRVIAGVAHEHEARAYAQALVLLATSVAEAYGETPGYQALEPEDSPGVFGGVSRFIQSFWESVLAVLDRRRNISPAENSALNELHDVLRDALRKPL